MSCTFYKGDCQELIKKLDNKSIDLIYFDPPFATTMNWWDSKLNWAELFTEFFRVLKDTGTIVIHCSVPFNYTLIREAPRPPSYSWYWKKEATTTPLLAKVQPMRNTEEILVWKNKKTTFYPQRVGTETRQITSNGQSTYVNKLTRTILKQTVIGKYQTHFIDMKRPPTHGKNKTFFSTRPEELVELMLKSYSKEGDKVLDITCYKGLSGQVSKRLKRHWIGFDKYFYPTLLIGPS